MENRKRILIVDDEPPVLFVLRHALGRSREGYDIFTSSDGQGALDEMRLRPFDLMITDLRLPDMDGAALTEKVRQLSPEVPVIWITAYGSSEARADAIRLGVSRFLDKPIELYEFRLAVQQTLQEAAKHRQNLDVWPEL